jgi:hypothetical protein
MAATNRKRPRRTVRKEGGFTVHPVDIAEARPFRWLWQDRIVLGYLNLMVGEEGAGKGTFLCWVAARVTKGDLAGTLEGEPASVVIIGDEDSWKHVWTPRLVAAGADAKRCVHIDSTEDGSGIDVTDDAQMGNLETYIRDHGIKLVFFDAMLDNLGYTDSWKDKQVRHAFAKLRQVADRTDCAVVFSMHPNKRGGSFRDRVSGTPAFNALSRSSMLIAKHPNEPDRRVMVRPKGNYAAEPPAFEFDIATRVVGKHNVTATTVRNITETDLRADAVLDGSQGSRADSTSKAGYARQRITELLADGEPHSAAEVVAQIQSERDIPDTTVKTAALALRVDKRKVGFKEGWTWQLTQ